MESSLNLVSIGARGYSVLAREHKSGWSSSNTGSQFRYHFIENEKCSSGTGENMHKIANRFGLSLTEADQLALTAEESIPITARCSVFSKSEMTHYANQGKSTPNLYTLLK